MLFFGCKIVGVNLLCGIVSWKKKIKKGCENRGNNYYLIWLINNFLLLLLVDVRGVWLIEYRSCLGGLRG